MRIYFDAGRVAVYGCRVNGYGIGDARDRIVTEQQKSLPLAKNSTQRDLGRRDM
jgi:hypothetical protein